MTGQRSADDRERQRAAIDRGQRVAGRRWQDSHLAIPSCSTGSMLCIR